MGCRAQVAIEQYEGSVYLYSHWGGYELPQVVRDALDRGRERWSDPEYLARIVFDQMVDGDKGTTGVGIGLKAHLDLEFPVIKLTSDQHVLIGEHEYSFEEYCSEPKRNWPA